ncbi:MAG: DUF3392 family protein [Phycisphaeraceae bacterium]|nr:DUF3392 family protein [Phycisphaeraceae bacterium]
MGEWLNENTQAITRFVVEHMDVIAGAISATFLVIISKDIDRAFKDKVKKHWFVIRTTMFILVCGVGYEVATWFLAKFLVFLAEEVGKDYGFIYLFPILGLLFIVIGVCGEKKGFI